LSQLSRPRVSPLSRRAERIVRSAGFCPAPDAVRKLVSPRRRALSGADSALQPARIKTVLSAGAAQGRRRRAA